MKKVLIITVVCLVIFVLAVILLNSLSGESNTKKIKDYITDQGYSTTDDSLFYQKIVSNNTLDDYYNDVDNKKDSTYDEYYFNKDSYSFIELKMIYKNEISQVFNVTSDFTNNKVSYNYEISKNNSSIILDGDYVSGRETSCNINSIKNLSTKNLSEYCTLARSYMNEFISEQEKLLSNKEFKKAISQVNGVVIDD